MVTVRYDVVQLNDDKCNICLLSIGDVYEGRFFKGLKQGEGTMMYSDGDEYVGEWHDNKEQGMSFHCCKGH